MPIAITKLTAVLISTAAHCLACTVMYTTTHVGPSFRAKVQDRGHGVQGLSLNLIPDGQKAKLQSAVTDKDGIVSFQDVPPGFYTLVADHDDFWFPAGTGLLVSPDGPPDVTFPLKWPNHGALEARSLTGALYLGAITPLSNLSLTLSDALSGKMAGVTATAKTGEFSFDGVAPGLYFVELKSSDMQSLSGTIAVEVNPNAQVRRLDLVPGMTSCGLSVSDLSRCPRAELHLPQLHGSISDTSGASIPNAEIALRNLMEQPIERTRSDNMGAFNIHHSAPGTYFLLAESNGFAPSRSTVYLAPSGDPAANRPLKIELGVAGTCSAAYTQ